MCKFYSLLFSISFLQRGRGVITFPFLNQIRLNARCSTGRFTSFSWHRQQRKYCSTHWPRLIKHYLCVSQITRKSTIIIFAPWRRYSTCVVIVIMKVIAKALTQNHNCWLATTNGLPANDSWNLSSESARSVMLTKILCCADSDHFNPEPSAESLE